MHLKIHGPPVALWRPDNYRHLGSDTAALDTQTRKAQPAHEIQQRSSSEIVLVRLIYCVAGLLWSSC